MRVAIDSGRLDVLKPVLDSDPVDRVMLLHPELTSLLKSSHADTRVGRLLADLEMFVKGQELAVSAVPYEHKSAYMGLLAPELEGTWEIRSRDPKPGIRVFGRFAQKDSFIALGWSLRSMPDARWPEKRPLRDRNSLQYQFQQIEVQERWDELFPDHDPLTGSDIGELLSRKYHLV